MICWMRLNGCVAWESNPVSLAYEASMVNPFHSPAMVATTRLELILSNLWDWRSTKLNYVANYGHWLSGSITQNLDNTTTISNGVIIISSFIRCKPNWAICILIIIAVVPRRGLFRINAPIFWQFQLLSGDSGGVRTLDLLIDSQAF